MKSQRPGVTPYLARPMRQQEASKARTRRRRQAAWRKSLKGFSGLGQGFRIEVSGCRVWFLGYLTCSRSRTCLFRGYFPQNSFAPVATKYDFPSNGHPSTLPTATPTPGSQSYIPTPASQTLCGALQSNFRSLAFLGFIGFLNKAAKKNL